MQSTLLRAPKTLKENCHYFPWHNLKTALAGVHVVSATYMFCLLHLCKNFSRSKNLKRKSLTIVSLLKCTTFNPSKIIHKLWECVTNCTRMDDLHICDLMRLVYWVYIKHARKSFLQTYCTNDIKKHPFRKVFQSAKQFCSLFVLNFGLKMREQILHI